MKKKLAAFFCGILCVCLLAVPVYAEGDVSVTITDDGDNGSEAVVVDMAGPGQEPVSVKMETIGDVPYITKVYELAPGADVGGLAASFEQDGFLFSRHELLQQEQEQNESKTVTQTETLESESKAIADIVAVAPAVVEYNEDGFSGQLQLDKTSIVVEENGASTYSYRVTDVREYGHLDRNDAAYVPKTVQKNGATLELESIEWVVMGQHPVDGRMVPNLFKAIATYAGTATGSRANGYTATLTYTGTVEQSAPGKCVYTVIFRGEPVAAEESEAEELAPTENTKKNSTGKSILGLVVVILLSAACLAVGGVRIVQRIRDKRAGADGEYDDFEGYGDFEQPDTIEAPQEYPQEYQQEYPQGSPEDDIFATEDFFLQEGYFNGKED